MTDRVEWPSPALLVLPTAGRPENMPSSPGLRAGRGDRRLHCRGGCGSRRVLTHKVALTLEACHAREIIEQDATNPETLYGARRVDFHTPERLADGRPNKAYASMFAGFFQLYRRHVLYPEWSRTAELCDLSFAQQFASCVVLPMTVGHCGVEAVNWEGRRSPLWKC